MMIAKLERTQKHITILVIYTRTQTQLGHQQTMHQHQQLPPKNGEQTMSQVVRDGFYYEVS